MSNFPLITIGITSYNSEATVVRAYKSAVAQDWPNFEIIVIDDCSTDSSAFIIEELIGESPFARLIVHDINLGPGAARNSLLDNANGDYLVFFDDDDESLPTRLTTQFEAIQSFEKKYKTNLVACYAAGIRHYPGDYKMDLQAIGSRYEALCGDALVDYLLFNSRDSRFFYGSGTPACALMARVSTLRVAGGFDCSLRRVEDIDFAIRLARLGGYFIGTEKKLFYQYSTLGSDKSAKINYESELKVIFKNQSYLRGKRRFGYAIAWFKIRYYYFSKKYFLLAPALIIFFIRWPVNGLSHFFKSSTKRMLHEFKRFIGAKVRI